MANEMATKRPKGESRRRTEKCPHCGELFSPQGLAGHLRFRHKMGVEDMQQQMEEVVTDRGVASRVERTLEFTSQLKRIRQEIKELKNLDETFWKDDETVAECVEVLEANELEIRNELRKIAGKPTLRTQDGFLGTRLVEEEDQGQDE